MLDVSAKTVLTTEIKHTINKNRDKCVGELSMLTPATEESIDAYIQQEDKKLSKRPTMGFFNNFEYIKENCDLGVTKLALELRLDREDLRKFMLVNDIPII